MFHKPFKLDTSFIPSGDQPQVIEGISKDILAGKKNHTILGVTGSGKTFTVANIIEKVQKPTLIVSHNKTLAAQLYTEFKNFFPENAIEYFVSYYDYYLPESYLPQTDTYIAKDSSVNKEIERFRLSATCSLLERRDVIIIASVSAIYGLGLPEEILKHKLVIEQGQKINRNKLLRQFVEIYYKRNDSATSYGEFSVRGDIVELYLAYRNEFVKIEFWDDDIERLTLYENLTRKKISEVSILSIFPAKHFIMSKDILKKAQKEINQECQERVKFFEKESELVEAQRIAQRTGYDLEMMSELGYCTGIENYSRYFTGRSIGSRPYTLIDFFPKDYLLVVDESHMTLGQFGGMYNADRSRKETLIRHGFRLPSALDNRPMKFEEFEESMNQTIYVSATPRQYELDKASPYTLVVRPTGLLDPKIVIENLDNQLDKIIALVKEVIARGERALIACMTKKNAEDIQEYFENLGVKSHYIHSEIDTIERAHIIQDLREGIVDCLIGINLLREGIDLPEVSLVCILDADKEGFLRSETDR